jgi:NAD(P)-dependent dehydrogenase (short-subunit alcohol dehydrogenase family)
MSQTTPPPEHGRLFTGPSNVHNDIYPSISPASNPSLHQPGKVVLITGAGRGIGRAMALQYAHANVSAIILLARTVSQLEETSRGIAAISPSIKVLSFAVDVTKESSITACAEAIKASEGRLDILINNAGASEFWVPLAESNTSEWWNSFEVNVRGPYLMLHAFLPLLIATAEKNKGVVDVVNVSSIGALMTFPGASAYQMTKLAVLKLTEFVHVEYAGKGVNCVAIHPGGVASEMTDKLPVLQPCKFYAPLFTFAFGFLRVMWPQSVHSKGLGERVSIS